jgi:hypothetical protein
MRIKYPEFFPFTYGDPVEERRALDKKKFNEEFQAFSKNEFSKSLNKEES